MYNIHSYIPIFFTQQLKTSKLSLKTLFDRITPVYENLLLICGLSGRYDGLGVYLYVCNKCLYICTIIRLLLVLKYNIYTIM